MENLTNQTEDVALLKFINKAKRKLNGAEAVTEEETEKCPPAEYTFVKSTRKADLKELEIKIKNLLKSDPHIINPIGKLIDHNVYDKLDEHGKSRYILTLSQTYNSIVNK